MSETPKRIVLAVCGGRTYDNEAHVFSALDRINATEGGIGVVLQGGAKGADALASKWCELRGVQCETFDADWKTHGRHAGPIRNAEMVRTLKRYFGPAFVLAFPGGRGTDDMCRQALSAGLEVRTTTAKEPQ